MIDDNEFLRLQHRVNDLENRLKYLYDKVNVDYDVAPETPLDPRIIAAIQAGNKIEAIKVYREITLAGLAEAKQYIDALSIRLTGR